MVRPWPVTLADGPVGVRPMRVRDRDQWMRLRTENAAWLEPWDATSPLPSTEKVPTFGQFVRRLNRQARRGESLPMAVTYDGEMVGQILVSSITYGALRSASIGYWVSEHVAGRGITPTAVALMADHCFKVLALHRLEINIRPENSPSLRVAEKLGFRDEGVRRAYLHIAGSWADHRTFAITAEEIPEGLLNRLRRSQMAAPA